jgi:hypothetical protein
VCVCVCVCVLVCACVCVGVGVGVGEPDPVKYVPAEQRLQKERPAGKEVSIGDALLILELFKQRST